MDLLWAFRKTDPAKYKRWCPSSRLIPRNEVNAGEIEDERKWAVRLSLTWWPALITAIILGSYLTPA